MPCTHLLQLLPRFHQTWCSETILSQGERGGDYSRDRHFLENRKKSTRSCQIYLIYYYIIYYILEEEAFQEAIAPSQIEKVQVPVKYILSRGRRSLGNRKVQVPVKYICVLLNINAISNI